MATRCFARAGVFAEGAARASIGFRELDFAAGFAGDFFCTALRAAALDVGFCLAMTCSPWMQETSTNSSSVIPGCARLGAGPESITTIGGYGFRARAEGGAPQKDGRY